MSSTNKTTNYELTQFLATDVPSWLVDYNGDMSKIDTQMKVNATAAAAAQSKADGADSKADTNAGNITSLQAALDTPVTGVYARLTDVEGDVDTLQSLAGNGTPTVGDHTLVGGINANATSIGDLTQLDTIEKTNLVGAINEIFAKPSGIAGRKFIFFGDSYGVGYQPGGDEVTPDIDGFYKLAETQLGLTNDEFTEISKGRAGFCAASVVESKTWVQYLNELEDDDEVTDIYVMGGWNDIAYYNNGLATAITTFISTAKTKFPNATIKIGFCARESDNSIISPVNIRATIDVYRVGATTHGALYLENSQNILKGSESMASDDTHPNTTGEQLLANYVISHILSGKGNCKQETFHNIGSSVVYDKEASTGFTGAFGFSQNEESITLMATENQVVSGTFTPKSTEIFNYYELGTINSDCICGDQYKTIGGNVTVYFVADGVNYLVPGHLIIDNKVIKLAVFALDYTTHAVFTPSAVTAFGINPFSITIPKEQFC